MKPGDIVKINAYDNIGILLEINVEVPIDVDLYNDFCKVMLPSGRIVTIHNDFAEVICERGIGEEIIRKLSWYL